MQQEKNILVNRGIPRTPSSPDGFGFNVRRVSGPDHSDRAYDAVDYALDWLDESNTSTEELFNENIRNIAHITNTELAKTRAAVAAVVPPGTDALEIELRTLKLQLFKARTDHQEHLAIANLYYGHDPLTHKVQDARYKGFELIGRRGGQSAYYNAIAKWNVSYAAAYEAKFLAEQIKLLDARLTTHNKTIAEAKAKAAAEAQARAEAEAKRVAQEQARKAAEAEAKRVAEERARFAAEAQRLAAVEEAAAQAEAQAEAKRITAAQARKVAEAETLRVAQAQALRQALAGRAFPMPGTAAVAGPVFAIAGSTLATSPAMTSAIQTALRTAIAMAVETATAVAAPALAGFAALLYSPKLANGELPERFAFSTPLSDLTPTQNNDLREMADAGEVIDLPVRLSSKAASDGQSEIFVVKTDGMSSPSEVTLVPVTYNAQHNIYIAATADTPPKTLTWTPIVQPGNSSTALPIEPPNPPVFTGASITPVAGRIDSFPEVTENSFDDYVFVFPIDSGLPPLYVMFRDRREDPGIALGMGAPVSGVWTDAAAKGEGAPIPSQIADQLRGKEFRNFREFRESFWKAVASDPILSQQFDPGSLAHMKNGYGAFVKKTERVGARIKYELHHKQYISLGGDVYHLENIRLMTPRQHIQTHQENKI
ncbi:S-type pyocin domain-containing protein [Pseudomonas fluorescens]|uniref:S-type pyocin domain-containing protein n=1 Tax=Pseudomonas fluorescens TaxID=294 RepID=UPI000CA2FD1E|nr:S-type pyocin domain-containing protein [Pseudomonas fluorescens]AUM71714.1 HNH nuclease [Pseudomonas fluorescens]